MPGIEVSRLEEGRFMGSSRPALVAEAIGTFLFFFVGAGSIVLGDYMVAAGGSGIGLLEVALAHGLAPAVTLGIWIMGRIPTPRAVAYVAAQLIGAAAAGFALKATFADVWEPSAIGTPALGAGVSELAGVAIEAVLTALLVLVVIGTAVDSRAPKIGGLAIGLAVTADILLGGPPTGAALNPARWFGPAVAAGAFDSWWVWWIGPAIGAAAAALVYRFTLAESS